MSRQTDPSSFDGPSLDNLPAVPDDPTEDDMEPLRKAIDSLDRKIITLLNRRAELAHAIGQIKKELDIPIYAPDREEDVLHNVMEENSGPLTDTIVRHIYERIIDETRSLERRLNQAD